MRSTMLRCLCLVLLACGRPDDEVGTATSEQELLLAGWQSSPLSFLPSAVANSSVDNSLIIAGRSAAGPVRYQNGALTPLLDPFDPYVSSQTAADVNAVGQVLTTTTVQVFGADLWGANNVMTILGRPITGVAIPRALNNAGNAVVYCGDAQQSWRWSRTAGYTGLPPLSGADVAVTDLNDNGVAVGTVTTTTRSVVMWSASNVRTTLGTTSLRDVHVRNSGEVAWVDFYELRRWVNGVVTVYATPQRVDHFAALSSAGRAVGTFVLANGTRRGWTHFGTSFTYLDPPNAQPGDYFEPTGVDRCGVIVGVMHTAAGQTGATFARSAIFNTCDTAPVLTTF